MDTLRSSIRRRMTLLRHTARTNAFRLVHGEADFLPGLAVDVFGDTVICKISARVAWDHRHLVVKALRTLLNPTRIIVSTDPAFCGIEQLKEETERYPDEQVPPTIRFREHGLSYLLEPGSGQKSGFFCDQRDNRVRIASYARGRTCLDACCYTGAFSLNLLRGGADSVTALDSSSFALEMLGSQASLNVLDKHIPEDSLSRLTTRQEDVFAYLRAMERDHYDLIILDPPKLAQTKAQVDGALRAYKDLNRLAIQKIRSGGIIATFSCSAAVSRDQLRMTIAWAAKDANREVQILETLGQGRTIPSALLSESEYLKGSSLPSCKVGIEPGST